MTTVPPGEGGGREEKGERGGGRGKGETKRAKGKGDKYAFLVDIVFRKKFQNPQCKTQQKYNEHNQMSTNTCFENCFTIFTLQNKIFTLQH